MATTKQTRKLYDLELIFSPNARNRYTVIKDGQATYPVGVTTVLNKILAKEALMLWPMYEAINWLKSNSGDFEGAEKAHTVKSTKGKDVGTVVHDWIEKYLNLELPAPAHVINTYPAVAEKPCEAFARWFQDTRPKVLATEQIVYSLSEGYAGTFDALLEIDGKIVLCDVKTTNASRSAPLGIYPENFVQLGGYSLAYYEEANATHEYPQIKEIDDLMVINANKEGKLSTLRASDLGLSVEDCEQAWLNLYKVYKFIEPLKEKIKG